MAYEAILQRLSLSQFRARFKLKEKELAYINQKGIDTIREHAVTFIETRLSDTSKVVDGKQTPMRGHPVFIAQHATATCCRECLQKWHGIPKGRPLTEKETAYTVGLIMEWIDRQRVQLPPAVAQ